MVYRVDIGVPLVVQHIYSPICSPVYGEIPIVAHMRGPAMLLLGPNPWVPNVGPELFPVPSLWARTKPETPKP